MRNAKRHGHTIEEQKKPKRDRALACCRALDDLNPEDQKFFAESNRWESWNTDFLLAYLSWAEPLVTKCAKAPHITGAGKWDATLGEISKLP